MSKLPKSALLSKKQKRIFKISFVLLVMVSIGIGFFVGLHARRVLHVTAHQGRVDQSADCAVVLTGGPGRVREGFALLSQRQIKKLIISGVHPQATLREVFPQFPFYGISDERDIILEKRSTTTYGNVMQSLSVVEALRCRSLLVVTSSLHLYRSLRTFLAHRPEGLIVQGRAVDVWPVPTFFDQSLEILKSGFYDLWAY